jgi:hypothetical protein
MTEAEWLVCEDPRVLLAKYHLARVSERKMRLFACACCYWLWDRLDSEEIRQCLHAAELLADGHLDTRTAGIWYRRACVARDNLLGLDGREAKRIAYNVVAKAIALEEFGLLHRDVAQAVAAGQGVWEGSLVWVGIISGVSKQLLDYLRDLFNNPFRPVAVDQVWLAWNDRCVVNLAQAAYEDRDPKTGHLDRTRMAVLADALEEAGCSEVELLGHLRGRGPHVRGCWVIDHLLGKE